MGHKGIRIHLIICLINVGYVYFLVLVLLRFWCVLAIFQLHFPQTTLIIYSKNWCLNSEINLKTKQEFELEQDSNQYNYERNHNLQWNWQEINQILENVCTDIMRFNLKDLLVYILGWKLTDWHDLYINQRNIRYLE